MRRARSCQSEPSLRYSPKVLSQYCRLLRTAAAGRCAACARPEVQGWRAHNTVNSAKSRALLSVRLSCALSNHTDVIETVLCNRLGGVFQSEKSWLFSHSQATLNAAAQHEIATEMQVASPNEGVRILGAPYGGEDWCRNWLEEKNAEIKTHFDAIAELGRHDDTNSAQCAFLLLKFCAATKFAHLLRMVPLDRHQSQ